MDEDALWIRRARRLQTEWRNWEFAGPLVRLLDPLKAGSRRLNLFTAACVRRLASTPYLGENAWVVEALERHAESPPSPEEMLRIATALRAVRLRCTEVMGGHYWQASIDYAEEPERDPWLVAWGTADATIVGAGRLARICAGLEDDRPKENHRAFEERAVCDLIRCVFGNPFRPAELNSSWLTTTVVALAHSIYEE